MKNKKGSGQKKANKRLSLSKDSFFAGNDSKRRRKVDRDGKGDVVESSNSEDDYHLGGSDAGEDEATEEKEEQKETADEARKRLAMAHLDRMRDIARRAKEEDEDEEESEKEDEEGARDSLVAQILQQKQLEDSGRVRRSIASRLFFFFLENGDVDLQNDC